MVALNEELGADQFSMRIDPDHVEEVVEMIAERVKSKVGPRKSTFLKDSIGIAVLIVAFCIPVVLFSGEPDLVDLIKDWIRYQ